MKLWSHQTLICDDELSGEPDYFVSAWRDEVIDKLINTPVLAVVEAKRQDFEAGWGQIFLLNISSSIRFLSHKKFWVI